MSYFYFSVFPHFRKHGENTLKQCRLMNQRTGSTHNTNKNIFPAHPFFFTQVFSTVSDSTLYIFFLCASIASILPREEKTLIERTKVWVFPFFFVDVGYVRWIGFTQWIFVQYDSVAELDSNVFIQWNKIFLAFVQRFSYSLYHVRLWVFSVLCCALLIFCACG